MKLIMGALSVGLYARDIIIKKTDNGFESLFKEIPKLPVFLKNGSNKENLIRSMLLHRINEDIGLAGYDVDYDQVFFLLFVTILGGAGELEQIHTLNHFIRLWHTVVGAILTRIECQRGFLAMELIKYVTNGLNVTNASEWTRYVTVS